MGFFFKLYIIFPILTILFLLCMPSCFFRYIELKNTLQQGQLVGLKISDLHEFFRKFWHNKKDSQSFNKDISKYISKLNKNLKLKVLNKITVFSVRLYFLHAILGFWLFWNVCISNKVYYYTLGTWINCNLFVVNFGFIFDALSVCMLLTVSIVSIGVHFYSLEYMDGDPSRPRFIIYLSLFTFFMFILVTADNLVQLFLGWEGIGLCSYLLISFWNTRVQANKAAVKALVVNRVGDFGYICGLLVLFYFFRSVDFSVLFAVAPFFYKEVITIFGVEFFCLDLACLFLFLGSMGKSAQIGLHTWLPDAMEGPTPVSALIHAATLVTAGVFLIVRCSPIFEYTSLALFIVMLFGGMTSFFAATIAITQNDIKKVIAYSTCSQLGYMIFACGISAYDSAMFHLINHAFFKAALFLGAGLIIHAAQGEQDMRKFGSFLKLLPYTYTIMFISFVALSGLPYLSGFYSKDLILEVAYAQYNVSGTFVYWLGTLSAGLTAFYSWRVMYITFWGKPNSFKYYIKNIHEIPLAFNSGYFVPVYILSIGSIFSGYCFQDAFNGIGSSFWGNAIYIAQPNSLGMDHEFISIISKNIPIIFSITGIIVALTFNLLIYTTRSNQLVSYPQKQVKIISFLNKKWYFDYVYNYYIGYSVLKHSYISFYKLIDKGFIEIVGPQGLSKAVFYISKQTQIKQSAYIYHLACLLIIWLLVLTYISFIF